MPTRRSDRALVLTLAAAAAVAGSTVVLATAALPAGASNPCTSATPPEGCPPLPPPRHHGIPKPVPPEHFSFVVAPPAIWSGRAAVTFTKVRLDAATESTVGDPGAKPRGYSGRVACSNGSSASAAAEVAVDPAGPIRIDHAGGGVKRVSATMLVVPTLWVDTPVVTEPITCDAWLTTPPDTHSTIDRAHTSVAQRLGEPLAVGIEGVVELL